MDTTVIATTIISGRFSSIYFLEATKKRFCIFSVFFIHLMALLTKTLFIFYIYLCCRMNVTSTSCALTDKFRPHQLPPILHRFSRPPEEPPTTIQPGAAPEPTAPVPVSRARTTSSPLSYSGRPVSPALGNNLYAFFVGFYVIFWDFRRIECEC